MKEICKCSYCRREIVQDFILMTDAKVASDNKIELPEDVSSSNGYCDLFCLMKDLSENVQTSYGHTLN